MSYILFSCEHAFECRQAAKILVENGHTVVITNDGAEALKIIEERGEVPSVIFAHHLLPNLDGEELFFCFRRQFPDARTKKILGLTMPHWRHWDGLIDSYVMRPYSPWQLVLQVEQMLSEIMGQNGNGKQNVNNHSEICSDLFAPPTRIS